MKTLSNLVLFLSLSLGISTAMAQPTVAIDCGSTSSYTASDGTVYSADTYVSGGANFTATTTTSGSDPALYQHYRYGTSVFTYTIPLSNGNYVVHLKYAEMNEHQAVGAREFNVAIQGTTVATNFDILDYVPTLTPLDVPYNATVTGGTLTISQTSVVANSELAAIVIQSVPTFTDGPATSTATVGTAYSFTYTASGTPAPTFTVAAGSLPPGLTLSSAGVLSGTPTTGGIYSGTVSAANTGGSVIQNFSITVGQAPSFTDGPATASGTVGTAYSFTYTANGYPTPTFSKTAGTLPPGVTLSSAGILSGTPTTSGTYSGTVTASNSAGSATQNFNIAIGSGSGTLVMAIDCGSTSAYTASDGTVYSADTHVTGGANFTATTTPSGPDPALYQHYLYSTSTFTYTLPLANGSYVVHLKYAEMNASQPVGGRVFNVAIQGTTVATNFDIRAHVAALTPLDVPYSATVTSGTLTISQTNVTANSELAAIVIDAVGTVAPTITGTAPSGTVGTAYSFSYTTSGSPTPTCTVTAGSLPPGITLSSAGTLSGTPTTAGTYSGTVTASNAAGSATQNFNIIISPASGAGVVVAAIDCGSTSAYTGSTWTSYTGGSGTVYSADTYVSGGTATTVSESLLGLGYTGYDPNLYLSFRSGACTYTIPNMANGTYVVALQYCETTSGNTIGSRVFNVVIQGATVLSNFDILTKAPLYTPIYETFNATVTNATGGGSNGTLTIAQTNGSASVPTISAIVVRTLPVPPTKIILGEYFDYFLVNGKLNALAANRGGEAGLPYPSISSAPFPARPPSAIATTTFTDAACGGYQTVALDNTGKVWCWGTNIFGEDGIGTTDSSTHLPAQVATDNTGATFGNVVAVASGFHYEVALKSDGTVWVWGLSGSDGAGFDSTGIIGDGSGTGAYNVTRPTKVTGLSGVTITKIRAGSNEILALDSTGAVWSWGGGTGSPAVDNRGTGATDPSTPTKLTGLPSSITDIAAGSNTFYAIDSSKNLWGWGYYGAWMCIGDGINNYHPTASPVQISFSSINGHVSSVIISQLSTHVLLDTGTMWGWGSSARGEVGNGLVNNWATATPPYSWDYGSFEQMVMSPTQVLSNVESIYGTDQGGSVFAIKNDGTIWSWGFNKTSFLGNGVCPFGVDNATYPDTWDTPLPAQVQPY